MAKPNKSGYGWLIIIIVFLIVGLYNLIGLAIGEEENKTIQKYHDSMAVLEVPDSVAVNGEKAVAYVVNNRGSDNPSLFSTDYVPEGYTTENPEEVRYILYCNKDSDVVGAYSNGGGTGNRAWVEIQIFDRTLNQIVSTRKFVGGNPPSSVSSAGVHYGSEPDSEEIREWILSVFSGYVTVHAKVHPNWSLPRCWAWSSESGRDAFEAWPGEAMTADGEWYSVQVPVWINYVIINGSEGTIQTADLPVESGYDLWIVVEGNGSAKVFYGNPDA